MKLSLAGRFTCDADLASPDFDINYLPPCRPPVTVIRRRAPMAPPSVPSHTRSEQGVIAPTTIPAWWLVVRSTTGILRVSQECRMGETVEYQSKIQAQAERFLAGISTSAYKSGKVSSPAVNGRGRAVFCPIEGKV